MRNTLYTITGFVLFVLFMVKNFLVTARPLLFEV